MKSCDSSVIHLNEICTIKRKISSFLAVTSWLRASSFPGSCWDNPKIYSLLLSTKVQLEFWLHSLYKIIIFPLSPNYKEWLYIMCLPVKQINQIHQVMGVGCINRGGISDAGNVGVFFIPTKIFRMTTESTMQIGSKNESSNFCKPTKDFYYGSKEGHLSINL